MGKDRFWEHFDDKSKNYVDTVMDAERDFYEKSARFINDDLISGGTALDIGNGGIINYDSGRLAHLDCADIYSAPDAAAAYRDSAHIDFISADITDMRGIEDASYDAVIVQNVIHHLALGRYGDTYRNCVRAMNECVRVLKRGGKLIVCESTAKDWFEVLERLFYLPMVKCCDLIGFDRVYQYSRRSLRAILSNRIAFKTRIVREEDIGQGEYVLFLGRKIRSDVLPLSVAYFVVEKEE